MASCEKRGLGQAVGAGCAYRHRATPWGDRSSWAPWAPASAWSLPAPCWPQQHSHGLSQAAGAEEEGVRGGSAAAVLSCAMLC